MGIDGLTALDLFFADEHLMKSLEGDNLVKINIDTAKKKQRSDHFGGYQFHYKYPNYNTFYKESGHSEDKYNSSSSTVTGPTVPLSDFSISKGQLSVTKK